MMCVWFVCYVAAAWITPKEFQILLFKADAHLAPHLMAEPFGGMVAYKCDIVYVQHRGAIYAASTLEVSE